MWFDSLSEEQFLALVIAALTGGSIFITGLVIYVVLLIAGL